MSNKENFNAYKFEGPNLSVEPMQMKKKKKDGGHILRKSLAWNKAFFTEAGVLDSEELSLFTGTPGNSSREVSSATNEEGLSTPSDNLKAFGKNLFKDVPSASLKKENNTLPFSLKSNSPAHGHEATTSAVSLKVLPNRGFCRTGTKDLGIQLPLLLSSLKRPAKNSTCQSAMKESKLPKTHVSKPGQLFVAATNKTAVHSASSVKQAQIAQPVASIRRNVGLTGSKRSTKVVQNKAKAGSESVSHGKTNAVHLPIYLPSSMALQPTQCKNVDNIVPKVTHHDGPSFAVHSSVGQVESTRKTDSLSQNTLLRGTAIQHRQTKSIKPSGLRLPSPSLGYFGQPKSSVPQCVPREAVQADFSHLRETGNYRPRLPTAKFPEVPKAINTEFMKSGPDICHVKIEQATVNEFIKKEGLIFQVVSGTSNPRRDELMTDGSSDFNENFQCTVKQGTRSLAGEDEANDEDKLLVDSESSRNLKEDGILNHDILDSKECRDSTSCGQEESNLAHQISVASVAADASGPRIWNDNSSYEENEKSSKSVLTDHCVLFKSQFGEGFACAVQYSATTPNMFVQDLCNHSQDCNEPNDCSPDEFSLRHRDQHLLAQVGSFTGQLEDSENLARGNIENADCRASFDAELKLEDSQLSCQSINFDSLIEYSNGDDITQESLYQETHVLPDVIPNPGRCQGYANKCSQISKVNDPSGKGLLKLKTTSLGQIPRTTDGLPASSCNLFEKGIVSKTGQQEVMKIPPLETDICTSELDASDVQTTKIPSRMQTGAGDVDKGAGEDIVGDPVSYSLQIGTSVETDCHAQKDSISCNSIHNGEVVSLSLRSSLSESLKMFDADEHGKHNMSGIMIDRPENLTLFSISDLNPWIGNEDNKCLSDDFKVHEGDKKKCHSHSIEEAGLTLQACKHEKALQTCSRTGFVVPQTPQSENTGQIFTKEQEIADSFTLSWMEDEIVQEAGSQILVECSINHTPELSDQGAPLASRDENSRQAELADSSIMVEKVSESNTLPLNNYMSGEQIVSGKFQESTIFDGCLDSVPENSEHGGSEVEGSRTISTVCMSVYAMCDSGDEDDANEENVTSGCMELEHSTEVDKLVTQKQINLHEVAGDRALYFVNKGVDGLKTSGLPDKTNSIFPEDINGLVGAPHSQMDATLCSRKDTNSTAPICSKGTTHTSNKNTLKIIPPINVAPFSEEWLAAFEAAGEDILTMKSGAVQNSPPVKYVPEPRPWSPVKRKNTSIGPFDCTKFTSH